MLSSRSPSVRSLRIPPGHSGSAHRLRAATNAATVSRCIVHIVRYVATSSSDGPLHRPFLQLQLQRHYGQLRTRLPFAAQTQIRNKKTISAAKLDELPQGAIVADPLPIEQDGPVYPTVVLQARRNMQKFDGCVLLTRVGGFYELYFEQADEYGPLLNLKVAQKKTAAGPVPMVICRTSLFST